MSSIIYSGPFPDEADFELFPDSAKVINIGEVESQGGLIPVSYQAEDKKGDPRQVSGWTFPANVITD